MFYLKKQFKTTFYALSLLLLLTFPAYAANYTVVPDDVLYKIASLFKTTTSTIIKNNNLYNNTIYSGQVLKVPANIYTVKEGDSLYLIAAQYGLPLGSLRKANGIWTNNIYLGQKLIVPVSSSASSGIIPYTSSDLDLLARLIMAEAGSQPYKAQVAVGAVVINRTKSADFPQTISGVIYQKNDWYYQFTPVENGWINKPASADAKNAAYDALHGYDPTIGAIYYFDDSATNKWLWSKPIALRSGRMVFTY
jgi:LysM repeat protein